MFELCFHLFCQLPTILQQGIHLRMAISQPAFARLPELCICYAPFSYHTLGNTFPYTRWFNSWALDTPVKGYLSNLSKSRHITTHHSRNSATSWTGRYVFFKFFTTCNLIYHLLKVSTSASGNFLEASFYFWWTQPAFSEILVKLFDHSPK